MEIVLTAAAQVFAQRGYVGATTNHIAERAGVSIGTVYQYFPNKDALLVALVREHMSEGSRLLERLFESTDARLPLETQLRGLVEAMVDFHTRDPALHRVLFEEAPHPPQVRETLKELEERFAGKVAALLSAHPEAKARDPRRAAYMAVHIVESLTHHFVLHPAEGLDRGHFIEELIAVLLAYLKR